VPQGVVRGCEQKGAASLFIGLGEGQAGRLQTQVQHILHRLTRRDEGEEGGKGGKKGREERRKEEILKKKIS